MFQAKSTQNILEHIHNRALGERSEKLDTAPGGFQTAEGGGHVPRIFGPGVPHGGGQVLLRKKRLPPPAPEGVPVTPVASETGEKFRVVREQHGLRVRANRFPRRTRGLTGGLGQGIRESFSPSR
jgi:hypothetical protein